MQSSVIDAAILESVLAQYDEEVVAGGIVPLAHPSGLGSSAHWFVDTFTGAHCLRRRERHLVSRDALEYSQAVLWHAVWEGFEILPLPRETQNRQGFVEFDGGIWELLPWLDGEKEELQHQFVPGFPPLSGALHQSRNLAPYRAIEHARIVSAMMTLAQFHGASATFPLPYSAQTSSRSLQAALTKWQWWLDGNLERLRHAIVTQVIPHHEIAPRANSFLEGLEPILSSVESHLARGTHLQVAIQPSLGNAHRRHLFFDEHGVCGICDMTAICADSVARDVATLLGSLAGSDTMLWNYGTLAYESIRPLTDDELYLVHAFNIASLVLTGLSLLERVYFGESSSANVNFSSVPLSSGQYDAILDELAWQEHRLGSLQFRKRGRVA